jgi:hypothetical protein
MRTKHAVSLAATCVLAACGTEPQGPPLVGQWGSEPAVSLVATVKSVDLDLTCATFHADVPLVPDSDGRFSVLGRDHQPFGMLVRTARLTGQALDNRLVVHLSVQGVNANSPTYELLPGLIPTGDVQCPS